DLDDESLARLGQWPWSRVRVAELVDRLRQLGVKAIGFDIVFAESDRTSPSRIPELKTLNIELGRLPDHDKVFAQAVAKAPVVTGFVLKGGKNEVTPALKSPMRVDAA